MEILYNRDKTIASRKLNELILTNSMKNIQEKLNLSKKNNQLLQKKNNYSLRKRFSSPVYLSRKNNNLILKDYVQQKKEYINQNENYRTKFGEFNNHNVFNRNDQFKNELNLVKILKSFQLYYHLNKGLNFLN